MKDMVNSLYMRIYSSFSTHKKSSFFKDGASFSGSYLRATAHGPDHVHVVSKYNGHYKHILMIGLTNDQHFATNVINISKPFYNLKKVVDP